MSSDVKTRRPPTPEEIIRQQKEDAARAKAASAQAVVPAQSTGTAVALPTSTDPVQAYLDEVAPASMVGRLIKFTKEGQFTTADNDEPIGEDQDFIALCDETLVGWIRFHGEDTPPTRIMGLLYGGFLMPARDSLGDTDPTSWEAGLSGRPTDPWLHQQCLVLQNTASKELFTFATTSQTGRKAVGNLLRHYQRMLRTNPGEVPVIKLKPGGFNHRDPRVGWVHCPVFAVVGKTQRDSAAKPDTSVAGDMNDALPF
jgi:hypothetical protein